MPEIPILTDDLARRLERLVVPELRAPTEPLDPTVPIVTQFGQTIASKAKAGAPSNKVFCFNEADISFLPEILDYYRQDDLEPAFYLTPVSHSKAVGAALSEAGFRMRDFNQAILYGVPSGDDVQMPDGMTLDRVTSSNIEEYARTMAEGFEWDPAWRDYAIADTIRKLKPETLSFLVRMQGELAGVATLGQRGTVGKIVGGAVVPKHRRKGIHLATVRYRVRLAYDVGCDLLMGGAHYGSDSFKNQVRAGMRLAYVESGWFPR